MDFREIQYVLAIEKYQTLSGAARFLDITQPSLSKFLQNLENRLNVKLFCRIDNKMHLTYAGRQYVETGLKILDLNHQLNNTLSDISSESRGSLPSALHQPVAAMFCPMSCRILSGCIPNTRSILWKTVSLP